MKANRVIAGILAISLLATGALALNRWQAERSGKNVEIVADYSEMNEMAKQSGQSLSTWLEHFKQYGVQSVAIEEETLKSLKEETKAVEYQPVKKLFEDIDWKEKLTPSSATYVEKYTDEYDLVVKTEDPAVGQFIEDGLKRGLKPTQYKMFKEAGKFIFVLDGKLEDVTYSTGEVVMDANEKVLARPIEPVGSQLEFVGLGFDVKKIERVQKSGLSVSPRPRTNDKAPSKMIKAFEKDLVKYHMSPSHIIFTGTGVIGYDENNPFASKKLLEMMGQHKIAIGMIEETNQRGNIEQDGINELAILSHYDVVRVFPVVKYIQQRFAYYNYKGSEEIENTIYRAVSERNIRSVYFRPFMENEKVYITDEYEYERLFKSLKQRLNAHGLDYGSAVPFKENSPSVWLKILSGLGTMALGVALICNFFRMRDRYTYILLAGGGLGVAGALIVAEHLASALLGFSAAIIFPAAAILLYNEKVLKAYSADEKPTLSKTLLEGAGMLLVGAAISTLGGLYVGSMLSSSAYLIEMDYFVGVKATLAAPYLIFGIAYLLKFGFGRKREEVKKNQFFIKDFMALINLEIKVLYLILMGMAGVVIVIYLARSGHETNIQPSVFELIFRNFLENELLARPRTKEFLMAFPMVVMAFVFARKHVKSLLFASGLVAVIGFSSIANTFSHLRTPLYLSLVRTGYSVAFGLVIGLVAAIAVWYLTDGIKYVIRRLKNE